MAASVTRNCSRLEIETFATALCYLKSRLQRYEKKVIKTIGTL